MGICPLLILHPAVQGEPEFHTAVYIYNTAVLVVGIHDGLDNGKPNAAAAIFPCPCLIYLIELCP